MPTYDYECDACGHAWELFQKITDDAVKKCPECGKKSARRLFGTGAAVVFKGSGFYQTDYRSESYKKAEKEAAGKTENKGSEKDGKKKGSGDSSVPSGSKADSSGNAGAGSPGGKPAASDG